MGNTNLLGGPVGNHDAGPEGGSVEHEPPGGHVEPVVLPLVRPDRRHVGDHQPDDFMLSGKRFERRVEAGTDIGFVGDDDDQQTPAMRMRDELQLRDDVARTVSLTSG